MRRLADAEEPFASGVVSFLCTRLAVEQSFQGVGAGGFAFEHDAVEVIDLLAPGSPGFAIFAGGIVIDERHDASPMFVPGRNDASRAGQRIAGKQVGPGESWPALEEVVHHEAGDHLVPLIQRRVSEAGNAAVGPGV